MDKKEKAAAAAAIAATIAASGAAIDTSFDNPAEILQKDMQKTPKVEYIDIDQGQADEGTGSDEKSRMTDEHTGFKKFILNLPLFVRLLVVLPLWVVGHLLIWAGGLLTAAATPLVNAILSFFLLFAVIVGLFTVTAKAIFPDLPLGKNLNRRSLKWLLVITVAVYLADFVLDFTWGSYTRFKMLIEGILALAGSGAVVIWFSRREGRRRRRHECKSGETREPAELVYSSLGQTFRIRNKE